MLDKRSKNILYAFGIALLVIIISEVIRPKPINWNPSYTAVDKIPFGSYVLFEEIKSLFNASEVKKIAQDPFEFLKDSNYKSNSAYIFINDELYFDKQRVESLKSYVSAGNTVFMSARYFGDFVSDSLGVLTHTDYTLLENDLESGFFSSSFIKDSVSRFRKGVYKTTFANIDTLKSKALGYFETSEAKTSQLNYVSMDYGKGKFLFHTLPEAFTNYYLLRGNQNYAARVLSFIDAKTIYWDSYLKSGRKVVTSPMRFVFDQKSLKWAYYTLMAGLLLFVIIKGKREQRIIKVIEPLQNSSIEFTKTIGDMYFEHKDFGNIVAKKITYFLETVRSKFYLNTSDLNEEFSSKLALKSGNSLEKTKKLIALINHLKTKTAFSEKDIISLNKQIEDFKL
jgi:hypothetical protein